MGRPFESVTRYRPSGTLMFSVPVSDFRSAAAAAGMLFDAARACASLRSVPASDTLAMAPASS